MITIYDNDDDDNDVDGEDVVLDSSTQAESATLNVTSLHPHNNQL